MHTTLCAHNHEHTRLDCARKLHTTSHRRELTLRASVPRCWPIQAVLSTNAMDPAGFVDGPNRRLTFIYASSPSRGLEQVRADARRRAAVYR